MLGLLFILRACCWGMWYPRKPGLMFIRILSVADGREQERLWLLLNDLFGSWKSSGIYLASFLFASFLLSYPLPHCSQPSPSCFTFPLPPSTFPFLVIPGPFFRSLPPLYSFKQACIQLSWEMEIIFSEKLLCFVPEMQILPRVLSLIAVILMVWHAAPAPHGVSLTAPHLCATGTWFSLSHFNCHMYKLSRGSWQGWGGEWERDQRDWERDWRV